MAPHTPDQNVPPLPPSGSLADDQIIVWIEEQGRPRVLAVFNEVIDAGATQRNTYRRFVELFGPEVAGPAVRLYQMGQPEK